MCRGNALQLPYLNVPRHVAVVRPIGDEESSALVINCRGFRPPHRHLASSAVMYSQLPRETSLHVYVLQRKTTKYKLAYQFSYFLQTVHGVQKKFEFCTIQLPKTVVHIGKFVHI